MNAQRIVDQLMKAAGSSSATRGSDVNRLLEGLTSQLQGKGQGGSGGGIDMKSLLGRGATAEQGSPSRICKAGSASAAAWRFFRP